MRLKVSSAKKAAILSRPQWVKLRYNYLLRNCRNEYQILKISRWKENNKRCLQLGVILWHFSCLPPVSGAVILKLLIVIPLSASLSLWPPQHVTKPFNCLAARQRTISRNTLRNTTMKLATDNASFHKKLGSLINLVISLEVNLIPFTGFTKTHLFHSGKSIYGT